VTASPYWSYLDNSPPSSVHTASCNRGILRIRLAFFLLAPMLCPSFICRDSVLCSMFFARARILGKKPHSGLRNVLHGGTVCPDGLEVIVNSQKTSSEEAEDQRGGGKSRRRRLQQTDDDSLESRCAYRMRYASKHQTIENILPCTTYYLSRKGMGRAAMVRTIASKYM
jgi:hypothetical protein